MKKWTKFFILTTGINIILSITAVFMTVLKDVRVVDLVTFYATAFGAGASFSAFVVSLRTEKKNNTDPV